MNQKSLELEILAIKLEGERANGRCHLQQEFQGQRYCMSRLLTCPHQKAKIVAVREYKDDNNWSISPRHLCSYNQKNRQVAR